VSDEPIFSVAGEKIMSTDVFLNGTPIDCSIPLDYNGPIFRFFVMKELARMNMLVSDVRFDGKVDDFCMNRVGDFAKVEISAYPYRSTKLNPNVRITLDGEDISQSFTPQDCLFRIASDFDARLYPQHRRIRRVAVDGRFDGTERRFAQAQAGEFSSVAFVSDAVPRVRRAVVTLCVGDFFALVKPHVYGLMRRYADACGADFVPIEEVRLRLPYPHHEKFQLFDILERYEQVLFLDSDIAVNCALAPNIFSDIPLDTFAAFDEEGFCAGKPEHLNLSAEAREGAMRQNGAIEWQKGYFNTGVFVTSYLHRHLFNSLPDDLMLCKFGEQTQLNYRLMKAKTKIRPLDSRFNHLGYCGDDHDRAYFVHFAGKGITFAKPDGSRMSHLESIAHLARRFDAASDGVSS